MKNILTPCRVTVWRESADFPMNDFMVSFAYIRILTAIVSYPQNKAAFRDLLVAKPTSFACAFFFGFSVLMLYNSCKAST